MNDFVLDFSNAIALSSSDIGIEENSIFHQEITDAYNRTLALRDSGKYGFFDLPGKDITLIQQFTEKKLEKFDNFVVLGIGGSALGNKMLHNSLNPLYWNYFPKEKRNGFLRVFVIDNVDPELLLGLLNTIDIKRTLFNVITKSGTTAETMTNYLFALDTLKKELKDNFRGNVVITTDKEKGILRKYAQENKINTFIVPDNVGGRFSVLTDVGLLSASFEGINIKRLLEGAANMRNTFFSSFENPITIFASIAYQLLKKYNIDETVLMPYSNHLSYFADWFVQLWAESLGKKTDRQGSVVNAGLTPIKAVGATDQHSQIQLYNEGPKNKFLTFIRINNHRMDAKFENIEINELKYLEKHSISQLLNTEQTATADTLRENNVPNVTLSIPELNEFNIGKLIFFFETATAFMGELLNIDAFNQPGVENAKNITYALMGRKGFDDARKIYLEKKAEYPNLSIDF